MLKASTEWSRSAAHATLRRTLVTGSSSSSICACMALRRPTSAFVSRIASAIISLTVATHSFEPECVAKHSFCGDISARCPQKGVSEELKKVQGEKGKAEKELEYACHWNRC